MRYYEIRDDIYYPGRWYLDSIMGIEDSWQFVYGNKVNASQLPSKISIDIYKEGYTMDYTTNEAFNIPIVSERFRMQLSGVKNLQFIPLSIQNKNVDGQYYIMVVTTKLDCVDEGLSVFGKFLEDDPIRPDLAGDYSWFTKLIIDKAKTNNLDVFRINKAETYLIVSERIKAALDDIDATGIIYSEV